MVIRDYHKKPKSLCPRCGSPMTENKDEDGNLIGKTCPACHFSTFTAAATLRFKEEEEIIKAPELMMYNVLGDSLVKTDKLESDNVVLILDRKKNTIWIWKGKNSSPRTYYTAGTQATKLKTTEKIYGAKIQNVQEGEEPASFLEIMGKHAEEKTGVTFYRIEEGTLVKISEAVFTTGDAYIVDAIKTIYVWIGQNASVDEKFTGAQVATMIDAARSGEPKIITIDQGSETKEFKETIGVMKLVDKNVAESILTHYEKPLEEPVMYRISSEEYDTINDIQYIQVPLSKDSLDAEDVFLIDDKTNNKIYIWVGKDSNVKEKVVGGQIARKFDVERAGVQDSIFVEQDSEPEELKNILGME